MVMPKYHELFNQVMDAVSDGREWSRRDLRDAVVAKLDLTDDERSETMSGGSNRVASRVHWATESLFQSGAISRPRRGVLQITKMGHDLMLKNPNGINLEILEQTDGLKEWYRRSREGSKPHLKKKSDQNSTEAPDTDVTPDEQIEEGVTRLRAAMAGELIDRIRNESPLFLEEVVLKVLHAMGYGEGEDDISHLGGPGDGGVDGVINQDKLGLDQIYVQAKRYKEDSSIGPDVIQSFVGAVHGKGATRGVFITTSRFTQAARKFAEGLPQPRIVLVDGDQLAEIMLEHEIGVAVDKVFKVYKIDENFFED